MRKNKSEQFGDLLRQFLRTEGLETPLNERRIVDAWPQVMGEGILHYTGDVYVKNQMLYIQLKSPSLKANLMMHRTQLVSQLNDVVGAQVITQIIFC